MNDRDKSTENVGGAPESGASDSGTRAHMEQRARHVIFRGHVQGVGFRYTAWQIAHQYNVTGFVRNVPDGTVEMLLQGPAQEIDNCIKEVQDSFEGYIRETRIEDAPYNPRYTDFQVAF